MANPGKNLRKSVQYQAYRLVLWQLAGVALLAIIALIFKNKTAAFSVLMGGLAYGVPNLIFVWAVFRFVGAQEMLKFITAFFLGEMFKLFISAILFLIIVKYLAVGLLSTLVGFIGAIVAFWVVCMWHFSRQTPAKQPILRS